MGAAVAVPAIVSLIGGLYSAYSGNKARQRQEEQMKTEQNMFKNNVQPFANQNLQQGGAALGSTLSYYTGALANPREFTAPEQNRVNTLYAGQAANLRNQYGRGSYAPGQAEGLRTQQRAATEGIIQNARPMAAQGLGTFGGQALGYGYQGYGLGAGILGNVFQQGLQARQQQIQQGQGIGSGLFNAYQSYLLGRALNSDMGSGTQGIAGMNGTTIPTISSPNLWNQIDTGGSSGLYGGNTIPNSGSSGGLDSGGDH